MPPRTRAKQPTSDQTYTSTPPLAQKRFSSHRKSVKSHGSARRLLEKRQSTLTQIDFGRLSRRETIEDSDEDETDGGEGPLPKRRRVSRLSKSRTQTLTQMDFVRSRTVDDSEEEGLLSDGEQQSPELEPHPGTNDIDLPSDALEAPGALGNTEPGEESSQRTGIPSDDTSKNCRPAMPPPRHPQTPKRVRTLAVPSSQTPPTTPISTRQSPQSPRSGKEPSPLQERSTNMSIPKEPMPDIPEPTEPCPFVSIIKSPNKAPKPIESPTKQRAREFRARMDELRNGGALRQTRRQTGPFARNQVIRSSTSVSLASNEGEKQATDSRFRTGETQFAIGEETQAILIDIDLAGAQIQLPSHSSEPEAEDEEEQVEYPDTTNYGDTNEEESQGFNLGEPHEPLAESELTDTREVKTRDPRDVRDVRYVHPCNPSQDLYFDNYDERGRVPSSQNETPQGTRLKRHESLTQGRRVTFSDQLTLPIPQSPASTAPPEDNMDIQGSVHPASVQHLYDSQPYSALAASSPIPEPVPVSSPIPTPLSRQGSRFHTPRIPQKPPHLVGEDDIQAPSIGRTESLSKTYGTFYQSALGAEQSQANFPSSPVLRPEIRSSPTTPGISRFLRGPITVSQLIPDSLRSVDDSIGLPPRWTQDSRGKDDEDDDDDDDDEL